MARTRNYSAERSRRNAEARRWGFTSLDQMSKARRAGEFPSAAELRRDPSSGIRAVIARDEREMQEFDRTRSATGRSGGDSARTRKNASAHDAESAQWSKDHSKQKSTRFNKKWSAAKKEQYYQTFVRPWGAKRTPEEMDAYHEWQSMYASDYDYDRKSNPYVD